MDWAMATKNLGSRRSARVPPTTLRVMAGTAMAIPKNARSRSSPVNWNISQPTVNLSNIWCPVTPARRPNQ